MKIDFFNGRSINLKGTDPEYAIKHIINQLIINIKHIIVLLILECSRSNSFKVKAKRKNIQNVNAT